MSEHAPAPWRVEHPANPEPFKSNRIYAANGVWVCDVPIAADANAIVEAVNYLFGDPDVYQLVGRASAAITQLAKLAHAKD